MSRVVQWIGLPAYLFQVTGEKVTLGKLHAETRRRTRVIPVFTSIALHAICQHCTAMPSEFAGRRTLQRPAPGITHSSVGAIDEIGAWNGS